MTAAYARFQECDRPEPAQLLDFTVEIDTISEVQAGLCQVEFSSFYKIHCAWHRDAIEIEAIEMAAWRGSHAIWIGIDDDPDPDTQYAVRLLRKHFATEAGQKYLRAECDNREEQARWEEQ